MLSGRSNVVSRPSRYPVRRSNANTHFRRYDGSLKKRVTPGRLLEYLRAYKSPWVIQVIPNLMTVLCVLLIAHPLIASAMIAHAIKNAVKPMVTVKGNMA